MPASTLTPLDRSLRGALRSQGTAITTLVISVAFALYGTTGALEAARRALNVVLEADGGRRFLRRKAIDVASTFVLMALVLVSLVLVFVGGSFAADLLGFVGIGPEVARAWNVLRWPAALAVATLIFAYIYYVTPDVKQRSFRAVLPGAAVGVLLWLAASFGFSEYISNVARIGAIYGAFTAAILLVAWLWLTHVALLFGAELNAEIERERELIEGVPLGETLNRPTRRGRWWGRRACASRRSRRAAPGRSRRCRSPRRRERRDGPRRTTGETRR